MTEKQRETIRKLNFQITELKKKYKNDKMKLHKTKNNKYNCFICNNTYENGFVCGKCVEQDIGLMDGQIKECEKELKLGKQAVENERQELLEKIRIEVLTNWKGQNKFVDFLEQLNTQTEKDGN